MDENERLKVNDHEHFHAKHLVSSESADQV